MAPRARILVLGYARHGKDTVAEILRDKHGFTFQSSSMFAAENVVRPALAAAGITYATLEECYADRVNHRAFWYDSIAAFNEPDPAGLARAILATADVYVGMRSAREYRAARGLFDAIVWVDATARGLPAEDPSSMSITYNASAMYRIDNSRGLRELEATVGRFVRFLEEAAF